MGVLNKLASCYNKYKKDFVKVLNSRLDDFEKETKKVRLQKAIKKLS